MDEFLAINGRQAVHDRSDRLRVLDYADTIVNSRRTGSSVAL